MPLSDDVSLRDAPPVRSRAAPEARDAAGAPAGRRDRRRYYRVRRRAGRVGAMGRGGAPPFPALTGVA